MGKEASGAVEYIDKGGGRSCTMRKLKDAILRMVLVSGPPFLCQDAAGIAMAATTGRRGIIIMDSRLRTRWLIRSSISAGRTM